jgi:hypothetical protein
MKIEDDECGQSEALKAVKHLQYRLRMMKMKYGQQKY